MSGIKDYIDEVCNHIKNKDAHYIVKKELQTHLDESVASLSEQGLNQTSAEKEACLHMGPARQTGQQLNKVYNKRINWSLLISLMVVLGFGILAQIGLMNYPQYQGLMTKYLSWLGIGLFCFLIMFFIDLDVLQRHWKYIYAANIILIIAIYIGFHIWPDNNRSGLFLVLGRSKIDLGEFIIFLTLISVLGYLTTNKITTRKFILSILMLIPPFLALAGGSLNKISLLVIVILFIYFRLSLKWHYLFMLLTGWLSFAAYQIFSTPFRIYRLLFTYGFKNDPRGAGYFYNQLREAIVSTSLTGKGLGYVGRHLPDRSTWAVFAHLIQQTGYVSGLILVISLGILIYSILLTSQKSRCLYDKVLASIIMLYLTLPIIFNLGMVGGLLPVVGGVGIPFVSYGDSDLVVNLALVGLVLNIYRRRFREPCQI